MLILIHDQFGIQMPNLIRAPTNCRWGLPATNNFDVFNSVGINYRVGAGRDPSTIRVLRHGNG